MIRMLIVAIILMICCTGMARAEVFGSSSSNRYHFKNCQWSKKIRKEYLVRFDTTDKAVAAGYLPCERCRPPLSEKRAHPPASRQNPARDKQP